MSTILRIVNRLEEGAISLLLVAMTLLVFVEVVLRFGFNTGLLWAQEATLMLSAWMVLFGASYGVKVGSHIGVDALVNAIRSRSVPAARAVSTVAVALCLAYCGLFMYGGTIYLWKVQRIGVELEDLPVPKWVAHSILLIGFALLAVRFLILGWKIVRGEASGFHHTDEARAALEALHEERRKQAAAVGSAVFGGETRP